MNSERLLEIAEEKGFLDKKTIAKLRTQMAASDRPVSARRIVKLLLKRNLLTKFQAKTLLDAVIAEGDDGEDDGEELGLEEIETKAPSPPAVQKRDAAKGQPSSQKPVVPAKPPAAKKPAVPPELTPIDSSPELTPIDSSAELTPIDSAVGLTPIDSSAELTPIDSSAELSPIDSALLKPVEVRKSRGATRDFADDHGLGSLDDHGLESHEEAEHDWHHDDEEHDDEEEDVLSAGAPSGKGGKGKKKKGLAALFGGSTKKPPDRLGKKTAKGWDSPLMLIGGGGLVLLVALVVFLYFFLNRGSGDDMFNIAEDSYRSQSYTQAMSDYQKFLDRFPKHPKASLARVRKEMSMLRQAVDSSKDWNKALEIANQSLPTIKAEEAFDEARPELGSLLTNTYGGFVTLAEEAGETSEKSALLAKAAEALKLVDNPEYLPSSIRSGQQPKIEEFNDRKALIVRDINRDTELATAIGKIKEATEAKEIAKAYDVRRDLLARYPGLQNNVQLKEVVQAITLAERAKVVVQSEVVSAKPDSGSAAPVRKVTMADRQTAATGGDEAAVVTVLVDGAAYGIAASDGRTLWRQWLGYGSRVPPTRVSADATADALLVDADTHELVRVEAATGKTLWRLPIDTPLTAPVILEQHAFLTSEDGRVWAVDLADGKSSLRAQLPQTKLAAAGMDADHRLVFAVGQHSSMYVLSLDTLECQEVVYTGHKADSVVVPPVTTAGYTFVAENEGSGAATLHLLHGDANGLAIQATLTPQRLDGKVVVPMIVFGRRVLVTTDRGSLYVFDVDPANTTEPVRVIAKTLPSAGDRFVQYVTVENGQVFVAGRQLARFELQASRGELVRQWAGIEGDFFTGPVHLVRDVLVHVRKRRGRNATTVEASRVSVGRQISNEGQVLWSTELAAAPAMETQFNNERKSLMALASTGVLWEVTSKAMSSGSTDEVAARINPSALSSPLTHALPLADSRVLLVTEDLSTRAVMYEPATKELLREWKLPIPHEKLSCAPARVGDGIVVCSADGPVYLIKPDETSLSVLPFQPKLSADTKMEWVRPVAVGDPATPMMVCGDRAGVIYLMGIDSNPQPHLAAVSSRQLKGHIAGELAVVGSRLFVVQREGAKDTLLSMDLSDLEKEQPIDIPGTVVAGPMTVGGHVLVVTSDGTMHALDASGQVAWTTPMAHGPLAGQPLVDSGRMLLVSRSGRIWQIAASTGTVLPWSLAGGSGEMFDLGEPLQGQAVLMGTRLFVLGRDCTLYITEVPAAPTGQTSRRGQ
jgi:outer membrane protein assembly factor BamB